MVYTRPALLEIHERTHRSLAKLIEHCRALSAEALDRELPGFGYASVRLQLHHLIGAEEYWIGVLEGKMLVEEEAYRTIADLDAYRRKVARMTEEYLAGATEPDLNTPREVLTWRETRLAVVPAHVLLRTQTHIYQHQGQVLAQCRLLGLPGLGGTDFPLD